MGAVQIISGYQKQLQYIDNGSKLVWASANAALPFIAGTALATGWLGKVVNFGDLQACWLRSLAKGALALHHTVKAKEAYYGDDSTTAPNKTKAVLLGSIAAFEFLFATAHGAMGFNALKPMNGAETYTRLAFKGAVGLQPVMYSCLALEIATRTIGGHEGVRELRHDTLFLVADMMATAPLYWGFTQPFTPALPWLFYTGSAAIELHRLWGQPKTKTV